MFWNDHKTVIKTLLFLLVLNLIITPITRAWHWREDEFKLFDLSVELKNNNTDFYRYLNVEPAATTNDIGKAHRQLVLKFHPDTSTETDAKTKFEITNQIAYILKSHKLRALYDSILENNGKLPFWKGFVYYYTRHKLASMALLGLVATILMDYLKQIDSYFTKKVALDQFISNAKLMASKMSEKHKTAENHKSYLDLGEGKNQIIQCEITPDQQIFIFNEKNERVPLSLSNLLPFPSITDAILIQGPFNFIQYVFNACK